MKTVTNITENKLTSVHSSEQESLPPSAGGQQTDTVNFSYKDEAVDYVLQHQVNKLKQHHRRAFDLISKALRIDEEVGAAKDDNRTVDMYKKGISELERGILLQFNGEGKESHQAKKLQHKMKLNLDMAKKRLDWHHLNETRKCNTVLKHLSLPRNMKSPTGGLVGGGKGGRRQPFTPPLTRRHQREITPTHGNDKYHHRQGREYTAMFSRQIKLHCIF